MGSVGVMVLAVGSAGVTVLAVGVVGGLVSSATLRAPLHMSSPSQHASL